MSGATAILTKSFTAGAAVTKRRFVKIGAADGAVIQGADAAAAIVGVSGQLDAASGAPCDVIMLGIAEIEYGGNVTRGTLVTSDTVGKAVAAAPGAGANAYVGGIALVSGASGDIGYVAIAPSVMQGA